ncbi:MAG: hypothetical protein WD669_10515 [Pirellulales bacterium]
MLKPAAKRNVFRLTIVSLVLTVCGCGDGLGPVDPEAARNTLTKALDAWKGGSQPSALSQQEPPIVVSDLFWESGRKLVSYKVTGQGTADSRGNLRVPVTLTLQAPKQPETFAATYIVTVSPKMTVFREYQD